MTPSAYCYYYAYYIPSPLSARLQSKPELLSQQYSATLVCTSLCMLGLLMWIFMPGGALFYYFVEAETDTDKEALHSVSIVVGFFGPIHQIWWWGCLISQMLGSSSMLMWMWKLGGARSLARSPSLFGSIEVSWIPCSWTSFSIDFFQFDTWKLRAFFGFPERTLWICVGLCCIIDWCIFFIFL